MPDPTIAKIVTALLIVAGIGYAYWYQNVDTLSLTEVMGDGDTPGLSIVMNLFDIDTGLTRRDIGRLRDRAPYWNDRLQEVQSIRDPQERQRAETVLMAEMMRDPALKKIARKFWGLGLTAVGAIFRAL